MRKTLLAGVVLVVAALVVVFASAAFDLELESAALLGVAIGAVLALVPDRSPMMRLVGFLAGVVAALIGYFVRAGLLPDSVGGRAVALSLVLVLCVAVVALSLNRLPLWSSLLGAAAFAGAFEYTYAAAPPEVTSTSWTALTTLLLTAAVGFTAGALIAPEDVERRGTRRARPLADDSATHNLDDLMMENTK